MKKTINAIIQARMGSTRLPGKILTYIEDKPILLHVINRLRAIPEIDNIIVATSILADDDVVVKFCVENNIQVVRGSEKNVLERFGVASKLFPADTYIRATADNPMIDIELITSMIHFFVNNNLSYTCYKNFPLGSGVEIFSSNSLVETLENAAEEYEQEHVTPYMYQRMKDGKVEYYISKEDDLKIRLTVDTEEDLIFAKELFKRLYSNNPFFGIEDIKQELNKDEDLSRINNDIHQKILGE